jgi:hypothetical protein
MNENRCDFQTSKRINCSNQKNQDNFDILAQNLDEEESDDAERVLPITRSGRGERSIAKKKTDKAAADPRAEGQVKSKTVQIHFPFEPPCYTTRRYLQENGNQQQESAWIS